MTFDAQCPAAMHSSKLFPLTYLLKNPPAKASPAPFVSTISFSSANIGV